MSLHPPNDKSIPKLLDLVWLTLVLIGGGVLVFMVLTGCSTKPDRGWFPVRVTNAIPVYSDTPPMPDSGISISFAASPDVVVEPPKPQATNVLYVWSPIVEDSWNKQSNCHFIVVGATNINTPRAKYVPIAETSNLFYIETRQAGNWMLYVRDIWVTNRQLRTCSSWAYQVVKK